jgi:hypothetical protein
MMEPWFKYRPNFDAPREQQAAGALPPDDAPLIAFLKHASGGTRLAEIRAKYGSGDPAAYERRQAAARQEARATAILANIGPSTPFVSNLTIALYSDDFQSASSAIVSLVKLVLNDTAGDDEATEIEWRRSDVEHVIRDYLATLPAGGARRRKTQFCFSNPRPLTKLQFRLLQHSRNGGKLSDFCAEEGFQPSYGTRHRIWAIYAAVAHGVDLPPTLLDFRRGVWSGPTAITDAQAATVAAVLKRATDKLLPLIAEARQRIEPDPTAAEVAQRAQAARERAVQAGKASAASKAARRAEEKRSLTPAERQARAEAAIQKELEKAARARERDRKRKEKVA